MKKDFVIKKCKTATVVLLSVCVSAALWGCTSKVNVSGLSENTLAVHKDGSITELSIDILEDSFYSEEDLTAYVSKEVERYNQAHPSDKEEKTEPVSVDSVSFHKKQAKVVLTYDNADTCAEFNGTQFMAVQTSQMPDEAKNLNYTDKDGNLSGAFSSLDIPEDAMVVVTDVQASVIVPGKILYVSSNGQITGKSSAAGDGALFVVIYR